MRQMKNKLAVSLGTGALVLAMTGFVQSAEIQGARFPDTVVLGRTELKIQGVAVLKWAMVFNVYAGAFYLPEGHAGRAWTEDVPKKLELRYFREITADGFVKASDHLLRRNLSSEDYQHLQGRLQVLYSLFRDVKPGDRYSLAYFPGRGTELRLNDNPLGTIPGADFAMAYFGVWLGENPINPRFRDHLLGH